MFTLRKKEIKKRCTERIESLYNSYKVWKFRNSGEPIAVELV